MIAVIEERKEQDNEKSQQPGLEAGERTPDLYNAIVEATR